MKRGSVEPLIEEGKVWLSGFTPALTPEQARDLALRLILASKSVENQDREDDFANNPGAMVASRINAASVGYNRRSSVSRSD